MLKMRVVQVNRTNGTLEIVEREIPGPGAGQVRIKVEACGVCHSDAMTKEGLWPGMQYPRVPGHEVAGIVDAVGAGVLGWTEGQRAGVGWRGGHCVTAILAGAAAEPLQVPGIPLLLGRRSILGWPSGSSIDSQDENFVHLVSSVPELPLLAAG